MDDPLETVDRCDLALAALVGATDNGDLIVLADGDRADLNDTLLASYKDSRSTSIVLVWGVMVHRSSERNNGIRWSCVGHRIEVASRRLTLFGGNVVVDRGLLWWVMVVGDEC